MNEKENLPTVPMVVAPGIVPLSNEAEFLPVEVTVQTPAETGAEDKLVTAG